MHATYYCLTQVEPSALTHFHAAYGTLLKSSLSPHLRKRDKKREKQRAEEALRRKRRLADDDARVVVEGPKRGNGRRKRQRLVRRAEKLEQARARAREREGRASAGKAK